MRFYIEVRTYTNILVGRNYSERALFAGGLKGPTFQLLCRGGTGYNGYLYVHAHTHAHMHTHTHCHTHTHTHTHTHIHTHTHTHTHNTLVRTYVHVYLNLEDAYRQVYMLSGSGSIELEIKTHNHVSGVTVLVSMLWCI